MFAPRRHNKAQYYSAFDSLLADEAGRLTLDRLGRSYSDLRLPQTHVPIFKTQQLGITVINNPNPRGIGVMISLLGEDSALYASGVRCGHIITHVNGIEVTTHQEAIALVNGTAVGDELNFTLLPASPANSVILHDDYGGSVGVSLEGERASGGVFVKSLKAAGAAAAAGLQPGDEILAIQGNVPSDHAEATKVLKTLKSVGQLQLLVIPARVYQAPQVRVTSL